MFADALEMKLELTIGGERFKIPGANIKTLRINLWPYGYRARLSFWVSSETQDDELFPEFIKQNLIEVMLKLEPHFKPKEGEDRKKSNPQILHSVWRDMQNILR